MPRSTPPLVSVTFAVAIAALLSMFAHGNEGRAVQAPRMSLDMVPVDNNYDANTNTMVVGPIESCLPSEPPGDNAEHNHVTHLIIQDAEDVIGWQVRLNYADGAFRPLSVNFTPFSDGLRGQNIAFTNLPIDSATGAHRDLVTAQDIGVRPNTALAGAVYEGPQNAGVSADTPAKSPPDDTSYNAPSGGVLAAINLQVRAGQAGQAALAIDLDDQSPTAPGSALQVFNGSGVQTIDLAESALFDGYHAEGAACAPPAATPTVGSSGGPGSPNISPGTSPGTTNATTPSPGATGPGSGTPSGSASPGGQNSAPGGTEGGNGTPLWVYLLIAAAPLTALTAFAGWRFRSRLPWLNR